MAVVVLLQQLGALGGQKGLVVKGDHVTTYGLSVEHFLQDNTVWLYKNPTSYKSRRVTTRLGRPLATWRPLAVTGHVADRDTCRWVVHVAMGRRVGRTSVTIQTSPWKTM
eukprot:COSAG02_NODE_25070_length_663_cov_1.938596_1_plen_109_part_10